MTRNRIILAILIIAAGVFASFYGGNIPYAIFYLTLAAPIVSFLYTVYVFIRFKLFQEIGEKTVVKGEVTDYSFRLANEDVISYQQIKVGFFSGMSTIPDVSEDESYCLQPGDIKKVDAKLSCNYRGSYNVGAKSVSIGDLFNTFFFKYPIITKLKVIVLPRILKLSNFDIIPLDSDSKRSIFSVTPKTDEMDIEVRKYVKGDALRQIHWKNTARRGELMSRKFGEELKLGVAICMDLTTTEIEDELERAELEDRIIESSISIVDYCLHTSTACSVLYYDKEELRSFAINDQGNFDAYYNDCGHLAFNAAAGAGTLMENAINAQINGRFIIVTHSLSDDIFTQASKAAAQGNSVAIILFADQMNEHEILLREYMAQSAIKVVQIHTEDDYVQIFEQGM